MGVDLFFVLSGFLITGILVREKHKSFGGYIGNFYARRARRILPAYFVVLIITALIFGLGWLKYWYLYFGCMNFVAPLGLPEPITLPLLWSLAVEEQFYLLWPLAVYYYLSGKQLIRCAVALLALAPILRYVCTPLFTHHWAVYMLLPFRMDTLATGALIALIWPEMRIRVQSSSSLRWGITGACAVVTLAALVATRYLSTHGFTTYSNTRMGNFGVYEVTLAITTSLFLIALIGQGNKVLSSWPLVWVGQTSYSIYLIHLTAIYLAPKNNALIAAIASLVYATVMWFVVERPILRGGHTRSEEVVPQFKTGAA
jgi:peptidoglycan/LPS O-acetylase OafA/YrhL